MFNKTLLFSLSVFLILMVFTSVVKNKTRVLEKINKINKEIVILKKSERCWNWFCVFIVLDNLKNSIIFKEEDYSTYDHSKIFLSTDHFLQKNLKETRLINTTTDEQNKNNKTNQKSFYFQDYDHHKENKIEGNKISIYQDRVYLLFFVFFCLISIFATKIFLSH